ncbi:MAG TPA: hypothetical protein VFG30_30110 [Polyangiales bacterium]|nr:hypothetical protein [Polyangiales bacterium]
MADVSDVDADRIASTFRPNRKPLFVTVVANAVMALLLLGIPYLRGRSQAHTVRRNFADLSRCLMGGEVTKEPGLSLPQGDRDHFAGKVMLAGPDWPLVCRPALQRMAPEPAIFLWPSVKQAGADLRAAVELTDSELSSLDKRRKAGLNRVPERVLQALRRVQAATVLLSRAGGADTGLDNDAIGFDKPARLAAPARLPLMASDEATLSLYSTGTALEVLALDGRGVSYLRVADGKVDRERVRRTSFVRGALRSGGDAFLVWAMPDARCDEREDRCAGRPTGLAPYDKGAAALRDPVWKVGGHPAGRVDRVLQLSAATGNVWMLARAAPEGGAALLRFEIPKEPPRLASEGTSHSFDPVDRFEVSTATDSVDASLVTGAEPAAALVARTNSADATQLTAAVVWADAKRGTVALPTVTGEHPWTVGCAGPTGLTLAYGSDQQLRLVALPASVDGSTAKLGTGVPATPPTAATTAGGPGSAAATAARTGPASPVQELLSLDVPLPGAIHSEDVRLDRVRLTCRDDGAQVFWITGPLELWTSVCAADGCSAPLRLARAVSSVSVLNTPTGSVLALGNPADQVRVLRLDLHGNPVAPPLAPSACFEPPSGMCGTPVLAADAQRIVLTARDRSDMLALESTDGGKSFTTLSGLAGVGTIEQSTTSPLEQHRKRKGIE